jgi:hypothetical protein
MLLRKVMYYISIVMIYYEINIISSVLRFVIFIFFTIEDGYLLIFMHEST